MFKTGNSGSSRKTCPGFNCKSIHLLSCVKTPVRVRVVLNFSVRDESIGIKYRVFKIINKDIKQCRKCQQIHVQVSYNIPFVSELKIYLSIITVYFCVNLFSGFHWARDDEYWFK